MIAETGTPVGRAKDHVPKCREIEEERVGAQSREHHPVALQRRDSPTHAAAKDDAVGERAGVRTGVTRHGVRLRAAGRCRKVENVGEILDRVAVPVDVDLVADVRGVVDRPDDAGGRTCRDGDGRTAGGGGLEDIDVVDVGVFAASEVGRIEMVCGARTEWRGGHDSDHRSRGETDADFDET